MYVIWLFRFNVLRCAFWSALYTLPQRYLHSACFAVPHCLSQERTLLRVRLPLMLLFPSYSWVFYWLRLLTEATEHEGYVLPHLQESDWPLSVHGSILSKPAPSAKQWAVWLLNLSAAFAQEWTFYLSFNNKSHWNSAVTWVDYFLDRIYICRCVLISSMVVSARNYHWNLILALCSED